MRKLRKAKKAPTLEPKHKKEIKSHAVGKRKPDRKPDRKSAVPVPPADVGGQVATAGRRGDDRKKRAVGPGCERDRGGDCRGGARVQPDHVPPPVRSGANSSAERPSKGEIETFFKDTPEARITDLMRRFRGRLSMNAALKIMEARK